MKIVNEALIPRGYVFGRDMGVRDDISAKVGFWYSKMGYLRILYYDTNPYRK